VIPGTHSFTYDERGLLATQTDYDGTFRYSYDALGRNTRLSFPDAHARVQLFDDLGRITSRCYQYADPSLTRCYGAEYDPVGNPLVLIDPEGSDLYEYDALDRLTRVTRLDGAGLTVSVEDYAYNA
jgi:YD repeat-containing protein